jgi:hypothetical protein
LQEELEEYLSDNENNQEQLNQEEITANETVASEAVIYKFIMNDM